MRRLARPLLYGGLVAIVASLAKVHASVVADPGYDFTGSFRFAWTVAYAVLLAVAAYASGLPDLPRSTRQAATSSLVAPAAGASCMSLVQLVTGDALLPRFVVLGSAAAMVPWSLLCVMLARGGRVRAQFRDRVVVVAEAAETAALVDDLDEEPERPAIVVATMSPLEATPNGPLSKPLVEQVVSLGANLVVIDRGALGVEAVVHQAASLHEHGVRVRTLSLFYEQWLGKIPVSELERVSLLFDIREIHGGRYPRVKRVIDVVAGLAACLVLGIVMPFVAVGNLLGNRGPILYRQVRVGKNGALFTILKFRTMLPSDEGGAWTTVDDPRVTPFGRLLRRTHLDELPQVLNIVRGDLTLVGPRPEQPHYVEQLRGKLPFYDLRHLVRPGLTGWAQVKYGYAGDERDALEKLQYEFWYLRHQSVVLDGRIVGRTMRSVMGQRGVGR